MSQKTKYTLGRSGSVDPTSSRTFRLPQKGGTPRTSTKAGVRRALTVEEVLRLYKTPVRNTYKTPERNTRKKTIEEHSRNLAIKREEEKRKSRERNNEIRKVREYGTKMIKNLSSRVNKIEKVTPKAKRELFPNSKKFEKQVKLELKNYITKADFNKLVEKLDKPRTPAAQQLTKSNIAELLKPLINKKESGPKYSLFGSFYPKNKKDGKPLFSRKPESVIRNIAKTTSKKFRKEIIDKTKVPGTPVIPVMRTPTTGGQRKKHVIELIDRVIKKMKVSSDTEKKIINFYEALSEKYIKQTFGGKTREEVRAIIKKQVDFFNKKKKR
jgi:hypothetical protein